MNKEDLAKQYAAQSKMENYFHEKDAKFLKEVVQPKAFLAGYDKGRESALTWVSVDERLPGANGIYLIWDNGYGEAHFKDGIWKDTVASQPSTSPYVMQRFRSVVNPTHWLPLPSKPEKI